jgi:hypothetical protein
MTTDDMKTVDYQGETYYFEWHRMLGWMSCTKEGDGLDCPLGVWDVLQETIDKEKNDV